MIECKSSILYCHELFLETGLTAIWRENSWLFPSLNFDSPDFPSARVRNDYSQFKSQAGSHVYNLISWLIFDRELAQAVLQFALLDSANGSNLLESKQNWILTSILSWIWPIKTKYKQLQIILREFETNGNNLKPDMTAWKYFKTQKNISST